MTGTPEARMFGMKTRTMAFRSAWGDSRLNSLAALQAGIETERQEGEAIREISFVELTPTFDGEKGDGFVAHALVVFETDLDITSRWGIVTE